jgi:Protein of unknown function (DUF1592)/Protein of unknown function (DUF1588)/Protein of unknown function (DUF1595)/Protein of unknown function (DUF1585)/Protein of unknown function (DUF1587)
MRRQMPTVSRSGAARVLCLTSASLAMATVFGSVQAAPKQASVSVASQPAGPTEAAGPIEAAGPAMLRRLSADQYRQTITDIFGSDISIGGRFAPEIRDAGLLAVGAGSESITGDELEQYHAMAQTIAAQVVDSAHRRVLVPCTPASVTSADDDCAGKFFREVGELLYRRPLSSVELQAQVAIAHTTTLQEQDFYAGLRESLAQMLVSPKFLFRWAEVRGTPGATGSSLLDDYARASQLSFFLWNSAPDETLLNDARRGRLSSPRGLAREVNRMLASPRLDAGVRAFFSDMLQFSCADDPCLDASFAKDSTIYPRFTPQVAADAQEQTLRTLVDLLVTHDGDYRDVFTTRRTFLTPDLAAVYGVPLPRTTPNGEPSQWQPYEYPAGDPRAGILSEVSFVALHSHPGVSSAVLRGRALREVILCERVPDPPPNVSFKLVLDTTNPKYPTMRSRLDAHITNPVCAGCHRLMDPPGLAMENFDGDGSFRTRENGVLIDASGALDGKKFDGMQGLDQTVANDPAAPACLVSRLAEYALGRAPTGDEVQWVAKLKKDFITEHYRIRALLREIATSDMLYRVEWQGAAAQATVASTAK